MTYETLIPHRFVLDDGETVILSSKDVESMKKPLFSIYIPKSPEKIREHLIYRGFLEAEPSFNKGEVYGLRRLLKHPWELHIRIYENGFLEGEVEVRREYLEHLSRRRVFVVYEIYDYTKVLSDLFLFYKPKRRWVAKIISNFVVRLDPPERLTPWKPIVVIAKRFIQRCLGCVGDDECGRNRF